MKPLKHSVALMFAVLGACGSPEAATSGGKDDAAATSGPGSGGGDVQAASGGGADATAATGSSSSSQSSSSQSSGHLPGGADCSPSCPAGMICDFATNTCEPGSQCGTEKIAVEAVQPNWLIVLDRSCSMQKPAHGASGKSKWQSAVKALTVLVTGHEGQFRFGLTLFPDRGDGDQCKQGSPIPVPVGDGNEQKIVALLDAALTAADLYFPDGPCTTNITAAMSQAAQGEAALYDATRPSAVMLVTDGQQAGCGDAAAMDQNTTKIISGLKNENVPTFVVGFGQNVDAAALDEFAAAGGTGKHYEATDQAKLESVFASIAEASLSCSFALAKAPADASAVHVFFDDTEAVANDANDGFTYDAEQNQIELHGKACERIKSGEVGDIDVVFGCPGGGSGSEGGGGAGGEGGSTASLGVGGLAQPPT